jgi:hypothetical protein
MQKLMPREIISTILSAGYNVDFIDADAINSVGLGTHQILVIPPTDRIPVNTLQKIQQFIAAGGHVISVGRVPSMDPEGKTIPELTTMSQQLPSITEDMNRLTSALFQAGKPDLLLIEREGPGPVIRPREQIGFIRRKLPNADVYFVANTSNRSVHATATFDTAHRDGEQWNPDTGASIPVTASNLTLNLSPYESRVFLFSNISALPTYPSSRPESSQSHREDGAERSAVPSGAPTPLLDLSTDWTVTFPSANATETQPTLTDWTASADTLNYSGEAVYARDFTLATPPQSPVYLEVEGGKPLPGAPNSPPEHEALGSNGLPDPRITRPGPGMHAFYDPPIHEAAIVFLNGQRAGSLWHPPYRLDISKLIKPGENHLEIHVYNTAINAWSALPPHDYRPLIEKYGDRFQMQDLDKVHPIPSGILGTIHLVTTDSQ